MLSKNLRQKRNMMKKKERKDLLRKFSIVVLVSLPLTYGFLKLSRLKGNDKKKEEIKIETGDKPVEKKINIIVKADGGLNLRKDRNAKAEKLGMIPDGTKLEAKQEMEGWYLVDFGGKTGWILKEFTNIEGEAPTDPTTDWLSFSSEAYSFTIKYPRDWSYKDYGISQGGESLGFVAFSFSELPAEIPAGSPLFVPIDIKLSTKALEEAEGPYKGMAQKTSSEVAISGQKAVKYTYTDSLDNTEKTKIFFSYKGKTYIISENGGYQEDLDRFLKTFNLK